LLRQIESTVAGGEENVDSTVHVLSAGI
jgi:hypothetical protein